MTFVLDASVALTWCFEDEITDDTEAVLTRIDTEGAYVPALWRLEIANVLAIAQRRKRIDAAKARQLGELLSRLRLTAEASRATMGELLATADRWQLSAYDAEYLLLAQQLGVGLATLDRELAEAARQSGVELVIHS